MRSLSVECLPTRETQRYLNITVDDIRPNEYLVFPQSASEARGRLSIWEDIQSHRLRDYIVISEITREQVGISINGAEVLYISLTDEERLKQVFAGKDLLLDISGLPHHVWAPLLKIAYVLRLRTRVLYAEPESYKPHKNPASHSLFDLSVEFGGMDPLPGFAQLMGPSNEQNCIFVALLGFEGNRPLSLLYQLDPMPVVIPVVGVPGFQVEFPSYTVTCNQDLLDEFKAHAEIRYSKASCPFDIYKTMASIRRDYPGCYMYIAPVGTKPHGLGAILYSIANPNDTEILFDHPIRKDGRTSGVGTIHAYDFGDFDGY